MNFQFCFPSENNSEEYKRRIIRNTEIPNVMIQYLAETDPKTELDPQCDRPLLSSTIPDQMIRSGQPPHSSLL
jgi:hypothetical protein